MRNLVQNPTKVRLERPGNKKFRVADLGINISENPKKITIQENPRKPTRKSKEYTIMETAVHANPVYSTRGDRFLKKDEVRISILVFNQTISGSPFLCFSDGDYDFCLPFEFQMTQNIKDRFVRSSGKSASVANEEIESSGSVLHITESDYAGLKKDAERFGKVMTKHREMAPLKEEAPDVMDCSDFLGFRYLSRISH
jgi:hypothetical protein